MVCECKNEDIVIILFQQIRNFMVVQCWISLTRTTSFLRVFLELKRYALYPKANCFQSREVGAATGCQVLVQASPFNYCKAFFFSQIDSNQQIKLIRRHICQKQEENWRKNPNTSSDPYVHSSLFTTPLTALTLLFHQSLPSSSLWPSFWMTLYSLHQSSCHGNSVLWRQLVRPADLPSFFLLSVPLYTLSHLLEQEKRSERPIFHICASSSKKKKNCMGEVIERHI